MSPGEQVTDTGIFKLKYTNLASGEGESYNTNIRLYGISDDTSVGWGFTDASDNASFYDNKFYYPLPYGLTTRREFITTKLKPTSPINNIYKLSLRFTTESESTHSVKGFEINDISIVYRKKKVN